MASKKLLLIKNKVTKNSFSKKGDNIVGSMSIHTFGDSHASKIHSGWKHCDNIKAHHLGPVL